MKYALIAVLGLAGCASQINCDYAPAMVIGAQAGIATANIELADQATKCAAISKDDTVAVRKCEKKLAYLDVGVTTAETLAASTVANVRAQCPAVVIPGPGVVGS